MNYIKSILILSILFFSISIKAQIAARDTGIHFVTDLNWEQLKQKAKTENKFIFLDCYATWCGPCKAMDTNVYPIDSVGQFYNKKFISAKIQLDSTSKDSPDIKKLYSEAKMLQKEYQINSLPTFLFISPEGKLVHRLDGYLFPGPFLSLGRAAIDPEKQYYTLLKKFNQGEYNPRSLFSVVVIASSLNDTTTAKRAAVICINDYLLKLEPKELFTRNNMLFLQTFMHGQNAVEFFKAHITDVDSVTGQGFADSFIDEVIEKEEIYPKIYKDGKPYSLITNNPDWAGIREQTAKKYGNRLTDRNILWVQINLAGVQKNTPLYCNLVVKRVEKCGPYEKANRYGFSLDHRYNASAWEIFLYSANQQELKKALKWSKQAMKIVLKPDPEYLDTYANLLYKLGRTKDAIHWEEEGLAMTKPGDYLNIDLTKNLDKMKKGEKTWRN